VSHKATVWAWAQASLGRVPNANALLVLLKLCDMTRSSGKVWASQQYISGEIGLSTRTVAPAVRALEDAGLIVTEKRAGRADVIWVQLTPVLIFPDGPEDDAEFEGGKGRGRPSGSANKTPANSVVADKTSAKTSAKPPPGFADDTKEITIRDNHAPKGALVPDAIDEEEDFSLSAPKAKPSQEIAAPQPAPSFAVFWAVYPKRIAQLKCEAQWPITIKKLKKEGVDDPDTFLIKRAQALADHLGDDVQFAPKPLEWLKDGRWNDDLWNRNYSGATVDRRRVENDQRVADMLSGGLDALNRRR
jgi:hypothetical protein